MKYDSYFDTSTNLGSGVVHGPTIGIYRTILSIQFLMESTCPSPHDSEVQETCPCYSPQSDTWYTIRACAWIFSSPYLVTTSLGWPNVTAPTPILLMSLCLLV
jgi:hypothetical protein